MTPRPRLYRLAARCPKCGNSPPVKAYERDVREKQDWPADSPVQTVQCGQTRCGEIYTITAAAYHKAA